MRGLLFRLWACMLVLALTAGALTVPAGASAFAKGNGGKSAPLQIRVPEQLAELAALYNSASLPAGVPPRESDGLYIEIAADLNFFGESFTPFQARSSLPLYVNGNGRTLLNFPWELCAGGAKIENLTIRPGPSASRLLYNSAERVYLINSLEALEEMRDRVNRGDYDIRGGIRYAEASYRLTASLVFPAGYRRAGGGWQPIGTEASPFSGSFDGGSRTISNLPVSRGGTAQGLFGHVGKSGSVRGIFLKNASISGGTYTGGIAGVSRGTIAGCAVSGFVKGADGTGGITGYTGGELKSCLNASAVSGGSQVGGVAGIVAEGGAVVSSVNKGAVLADNYAGGLVGVNHGSLTASVSAGPEISARSGNAAGRVAGFGKSSGCRAWGGMNVSAQGSAAGDNGMSAGPAELNLKSGGAAWDALKPSDTSGLWDYSWGEVPVLKGMPGLNAHLPWWVKGSSVPLDGAGTREDPYLLRASGDLEALRGLNTFGKYYRMADNIALPEGAGWTPLPAFGGTLLGDGKTISGLRGSGGLFSSVERSGYIQNLHLSGVFIRAPGDAGAVANVNYGSIAGCAVSGDISGGARAGGVAGANSGSVKDCSSTASVSAKADAGGIAGANSGSVSGSYAAGSVSSAEAWAGGIATGGTVRGCVALSSSVSGRLGSRRIAGEWGTLSNNYAWSGMRVGGAVPAAADRRQDLSGGADCTAVDLEKTYFWRGLGFTEATWRLGAYRLPALKTSGEQPAAIPLYLYGIASPGSSIVLEAAGGGLTAQDGRLQMDSPAQDTALTVTASGDFFSAADRALDWSVDDDGQKDAALTGSSGSRRGLIIPAGFMGKISVRAKNAIAAAPSGELSIYVLGRLEGAVAVSGAIQAGRTVTADVRGVTSANPGDFSFTWTDQDGIVLGEEAAYTVRDEDIGRQVSVTATSAYCSGELRSPAATAIGPPVGGADSASFVPPGENETLIIGPARAGALLAAARTAGEKQVTAIHTGRILLNPAGAAMLGDFPLRADSLSGNAVRVRIEVANPSLLSGNVLLSASLKGGEADRIAALFEKSYRNIVRVVHFDQQGMWGQPVRVAARINLDGMDRESLAFYSYNRASNRFTRISEPDYRIDARGYVHFTTSYAGDILISDSSLRLKPAE